MFVDQIINTSSSEHLVFVHGWGFNSKIWGSVLLELKSCFNIHLVDLPGFGKAPFTKKPYRFEQIVPEILEEIPDRAIWVGWSLGGLFSWWTAQNYPQKVKKLITIASNPCFRELSDWPGVSLKNLDRFSQNLLKNPSKTLSDFLELQLRTHKSHVDLAYFQEITTSLPPSKEALVGGFNLLAHSDLRQSMSGLKISSLSIFGELDTLVPVTVASLLPDLIPNHQSKIIKRAGHIPFLTHTQIFLQWLREFCFS